MMAHSSYLLDVNLLIALAWPNHVHHLSAHTWFKGHSEAGWATCPLTQCAFVRISSNPLIIPEAVLPVHAKSILKEMVSHPHHLFWPDDRNLAIENDLPIALLQGHRQITDVYLLLLCKNHDGRLATLDSRLRNAVDGSVWKEYVCLIES